MKVSASQLSTFRSCPRKWAFDKIDKVPRAETAATKAGTAIHAEVEHFYKSGVAPISKPAQALLLHLPPRSDSILPESEFIYPWIRERVAMHGIVDLVDLKTKTIFDHKTTSNVDKYAKDVDTLRFEPQTLLYGAYYRTAHENTEVINIQYTYVQREELKTKPSHTKVVKFEQPLTDLQKGLKMLEPIVDELVHIRRNATKATRVSFNTKACYEFGGCQYRDLCPDYIGKKEKEPLMNPEFFALMKKAKDKANENPLPPTPTEDGDFDRKEQTQVESKPINAPQGSVMPVSEPPKMPLLDTLGIKFGATPEVLPPDAQPNVSPNDPPPPPLIKSKSKKKEPTPAPTKATQPALEPIGLIEEIRAELLKIFKEGSVDQRLKAAELLLSTHKEIR